MEHTLGVSSLMVCLSTGAVITVASTDLTSPDNVDVMVTMPTERDSNLVENQTSKFEDPVKEPQLSTTFLCVYFGVRLLWSALAIFGNMLTMVAVYKYERLQNTTSYFICSLAVADMMAGCLSPLNIIHQTMNDHYLFAPICLIEQGISFASTCCNVISIMWIAIDRYIFIAYPLRYEHWVTTTRTFIVIAVSWLFIGTETVLMFVFGQDLKTGMTCRYTVFLSRIINTGLIAPQLCIYIGITVRLYIVIGRTAYRQGQAIAALNQPYDTQEASMNRQQKKIAKMMIMVLGTFFASYTPEVIKDILVKHVRRSEFTLDLHVGRITQLIFWATSWVNPIIYAWKSKDFRMAFRKILHLTSSAIDPMEAPSN